MTEMTEQSENGSAKQETVLPSGRSVLRTMLAAEVRRLTGPKAGQQGLLLAAPGLLGRENIGLQGVWTHCYLKDNKGEGVFAGVPLEPGGKFDFVLLAGVLEHVEDPVALVEKAHGYLKDTGRLVLLVARKGGGMPARALASIGGLLDEQDRAARLYTNKDLFETVKDGFDVEVFRGMVRFSVMLWEFVAEYSKRWKSARHAAAAGAEAGLDYAVRAWVYPFQKIGSILDLFLVFSGGYYLAARAKKRPWRRRKIPVLKDGRSIADAAINTRIGSAAPF